MSRWIPCSEMMPGESKTDNMMIYVPKRCGVFQSGIYIGHLKHGCIKGGSEVKRNVWDIPIEA